MLPLLEDISKHNSYYVHICSRRTVVIHKKNDYTVLGLFWVGLILWRNRRRALPEGVCQSAIRVRKAERRDSGAGISSESYGRVSDEPPSRYALMRRSAPRFKTKPRLQRAGITLRHLAWAKGRGC